jgi:putative ABC transport system permease protein
VQWFGALARNLLRGRRRDDDLRANIDGYVDLLTDEKIAAGQSPEAARRAALIEIGSVDAVKESARSVRAGALLADVAQDTRYALRMMRRDLGFTAVAVVTLALGIGANTAIFSVVNAVLLKPLPYADADKIVVVWERNTAIGKERDPVAPLNYLDWRSENTVLEEGTPQRSRSAWRWERGVVK